MRLPFHLTAHCFWLAVLMQWRFLAWIEGAGTARGAIEDDFCEPRPLWRPSVTSEDVLYTPRARATWFDGPHRVAFHQISRVSKAWLPQIPLGLTLIASLPNCGTMSTPYLSSYTQSHSFARGMTRAGAGGERATSHLKQALAEIDGLFAGLNYIEKTDTWKHDSGAAGDRTKDQAFRTHCDLELDAQIFSQAEHQLQPRNWEAVGSNSVMPNFQTQQQQQQQQANKHAPPSRYDWSSIRNVKEGSEHIWQRFDALAETLNQPAINQIRNKYNDAKGLRETGVFTFRDVVSGTAPNDLRQVFAFATLSYVISCLLYRENRIPKRDILSGIQVWRDAIQDDEEREAFVELARHLWPEAHERFHFIDLDLPQQGLQTDLSLDGQCWDWTANGFAPMADVQRPIQQLQPNVAHGSSNASIPAPSELDLYAAGLLDDTTQNLARDPLGNNQYLFQKQSNDLMTLSHEAWDWSHLRNVQLNHPEPTDWWTPQIPGRPPEHAPGGSDFHAELGGPRDLPMRTQAVDHCDKLRDTTTFQVILLYLHQLSSLLHLLSGQGLTAKSPQSVAAFNNEQQLQKRTIQEQYLDPLASSPISVGSQARAILSVARKFVKLGYLQTCHEVQDYMINVGRVRSFQSLLRLPDINTYKLCPRISCTPSDRIRTSIGGF